MKRLILRIPDEIHEQLSDAASEDERSLNYLGNAALRAFLQGRARRIALTKEQP